MAAILLVFLLIIRRKINDYFVPQRLYLGEYSKNEIQTMKNVYYRNFNNAKF